MEVALPDNLNLCVEFLDHNLAAGRGKKTALLYRDRRISYEEVAAGARAAGAMLRELGVEQEERVLLALPDRPEFVYAWFGAARIGAVVSAVNPEVKAAELAYYLDYTRARVLFLHEDALAAAEKVLAEARWLRCAVVVGDAPRPAADDAVRPGPRLHAWRDLFRDDAACEPALVSKDDMAVWLYTSGSTGFPKAAVHLAHDFLYNALTYAKAVGYSADDVCLGAPKLFFGYALGSNLLFPFRVGGTAALFPERTTADRLCEEIARHRASMVTNVPTMINQLVALDSPREKWDLGSLRWTVSAGEALPAELYERWRQKFPGVPIYDGIGSAELFHIYVSNLPGDVVPGSLGKAVPGYAVKLVDDEGKEVPRGEIGTMHVSGDSMAVMYWNRHEASKETFQGNWCVTQDKFVQDGEDRYWYRGRADDLLKVGGRYVAPVEVENALLQHPAVKECAVVGYMEDGLQKPKAFVVLKDGFSGGEGTAAELQEFVKAKIQPWKYPRQIAFVGGLPRNDRGKVDRKQLKG